jgi:dienelactone hydrolase
MSNPAKSLLSELSRSGPHVPMRGDLALVGLPGIVWTPSEGLGLPAIAFGHGWLQPATRYQRLLRHLATWGIVAAAPSTQRGPLPSHRLHAGDLSTALDICVGVRLGDGRISVDENKLGLAGHSTGAGAAVLAAADLQRIKAVATVAPAETRPSSIDAAIRCAMPGLHLAGGKDLIAPVQGHGEHLARAWRGPVTLRSLPKASHLGLTEGRHWSELLLDGKAERGTQQVAWAVLTAFFLVHLAGQKRYQALLDNSVKKCEIVYAHDEAPVHIA